MNIYSAARKERGKIEEKKKKKLKRREFFESLKINATKALRSIWRFSNDTLTDPRMQTDPSSRSGVVRGSILEIRSS